MEVVNTEMKGQKAAVKAFWKQKVRAEFQRAKGAEAHAAFGRFRNGSEAIPKNDFTNQYP